MLNHNPALKNFVQNAYDTGHKWPNKPQFGNTRDGKVNNCIAISSSFIDILKKSS
jgi:hypothetical protein